MRYRARFVSTWAMDVEVLADSVAEAEARLRAGIYNGAFSEEMTGIVGDLELVEMEEPPPDEG